MKATDHPLISSIKPASAHPHIPIVHSTAAISPHFSQNQTACDSAFSAATASVHHIGSDSYDECETETSTLAHTQEHDKS